MIFIFVLDYILAIAIVIVMYKESYSDVFRRLNEYLVIRNIKKIKFGLFLFLDWKGHCNPQAQLILVPMRPTGRYS